MDESSMLNYVAEVAEAVHELTALSRQLSGNLAGQVLQVRRNNRTTTGLVVLCLLLVAGMVNNLVRLNRFAAASERDRAEIHALKAKTDSDVLCPMWGMFLRAYHPEYPEAKRDPVAYETAFATIEAGAVTLGCAKTTRGR